MGKRIGQWGRWLLAGLRVGSRWARAALVASWQRWLWPWSRKALYGLAIGAMYVVSWILTAVLNWAWDTWPLIAWSIVGGAAALWIIGGIAVWTYSMAHWMWWEKPGWETRWPRRGRRMTGNDALQAEQAQPPSRAAAS
jgi:hypothetical protein